MPAIRIRSKRAHKMDIQKRTESRHIFPIWLEAGLG
jgi:hypothetical protein